MVTRALPRLAGAVGLAVIVLLAFLIRLRLLTHGAGITASDSYDDGVYYAAADALVHGRLPYKTFLFLHPPGIVLALSPFAAIGAVLGDPVGVAVARVAFLGIGAANAGLAAVIAARHSRIAGVIAGIGYAVFFPLAFAERSTLLEPLGSLLLLAAVVVARRSGPRAAVVAGLVAGLSADVKIWYVVPIAILAVSQRGHRLRFAGGAVASIVAVCLPFFLEAPAVMLREVVLDQVGRPQIVPSFTARLIEIGGDPFAGVAGASPKDAERVATLLLCAVLIAALAAWRVRRARVLVVLAAATTAVLLETPSFYTHYAAFAGPWIVLVLAIGAAELIGRLTARWLRVAIALMVIGGLVAADEPALRASTVHALPVAGLQRILARTSGCVVSDDPGLLAATNVLSRDLAAGCTVWPDVTGWTYDRDADRHDGVEVARLHNHRWQRAVRGYLFSGSVVVVHRAGTAIDRVTMHRIHLMPVLGSAARIVVHAVPEGDRTTPAS